MKKELIILLGVLVLVTGCGKDEVKNNQNSQNDQEVINSNENANPQGNSNNGDNGVKENEVVEDKKDNVDSSKVDKTNKDNKTESTDKTSSTSKKDNSSVSLGKNEYISLKDNKVHKYTFTYPDEETCIKKGDGEPYDVVYPVKPYVVFGCEKVKDANGNILWGEYFYEHADESSIFYY